MHLKRTTAGNTLVGLAVAGLMATATLDAQKPDCVVSDFGRAQEKTVAAPPTKGPDNSETLSPEQRKAAAADAQKAVKRAQTETSQRYGAPKQGFIASLFSPSDPVKLSDVDVKRTRMVLSLERTYLAPVLTQYKVSCLALRAIVDGEKPAPPAPPAAPPK
jgi:hypothetical protein